MPPRNSRGRGRGKLSPSPSLSSNTQNRSLSPDDTVAIRSPPSSQSTIAIPRAVTSSKPKSYSNDSSSIPSTQDGKGSKTLNSSSSTTVYSNDIDNETHDWPASLVRRSCVEAPKASRWKAQGWKDVIASSSNLLSNVDENRTFWKSTNSSNTMHTLGIEGTDDSKGIAAFWVFGTIEYVAITSGTYNSWSAKVICSDEDLKVLKDNLQSRRILKKEWSDESNDKIVKFGTNKTHVKDFIEIIDDDDEREWMQGLCNSNVFPFTYNGIADANPNPGYDQEEFRKGRYLAVEFTTHAINFCSQKNPGGTFNYNFRMQSLYLIDGGKREVLTSSRRKRRPDEWLILPLRTRKSKVHINPLDWSVGDVKRGEYEEEG